MPDHGNGYVGRPRSALRWLRRVFLYLEDNNSLRSVRLGEFNHDFRGQRNGHARRQVAVGDHGGGIGRDPNATRGKQGCHQMPVPVQQFDYCLMLDAGHGGILSLASDILSLCNVCR
jgi:hypothetical protein